MSEMVVKIIVRDITTLQSMENEVACLHVIYRDTIYCLIKGMRRSLLPGRDVHS